MWVFIWEICFKTVEEDVFNLRKNIYKLSVLQIVVLFIGICYVSRMSKEHLIIHTYRDFYVHCSPSDLRVNINLAV
jgi:hypothetical protein